PALNLFRAIDDNAAFYTYKLSSREAGSSSGHHENAKTSRRMGRAERNPSDFSKHRSKENNSKSQSVKNTKANNSKLCALCASAVESKPFFKEYCRTGSGHPNGFTYGRVRDDGKNLYVDLEFTPDNTLGGVKDYAAVHVK